MVMGEILNVLIKQHQRGRWRYLALFAPICWPHDGASVLACAYQLKVRSKNPKDFEHWFSQRLWLNSQCFY